MVFPAPFRPARTVHPASFPPSRQSFRTGRRDRPTARSWRRRTARSVSLPTSAAGAASRRPEASDAPVDSPHRRPMLGPQRSERCFGRPTPRSSQNDRAARRRDPVRPGHPTLHATAPAGVVGRRARRLSADLEDRDARAALTPTKARHRSPGRPKCVLASCRDAPRRPLAPSHPGDRCSRSPRLPDGLELGTGFVFFVMPRRTTVRGRGWSQLA